MNTTVQNAAALSAARRLSVDVANLSYRLAVTEATQEEIRGLLYYEVEGGTYQKAIDPDQWQRRTVHAEGAIPMPGVIEAPVEMTDEQMRQFAEDFRNRPRTPIEVVLTADQADAVIRLVSALEQLLM